MKVKNVIFNIFIIIIFFIFLNCGKKEAAVEEAAEEVSTVLDYSTHELPNGIKWITKDKFVTFASPEARKGGTYTYYIDSFPLTFRTVGPDSNNSSRSYFLNNQMSLLEIHPNTEEPVPALAEEWAFDKNGRTMYFRLNRNARWSDGTPVSADDYIYTLEFMRSPHIQAPWYNDYYTKEIANVTKYDDYTISITAPLKVPDLWMRIPISPTPKHFYGKLDKDFVKKYNWKTEPNTGPYILKSYSKGKNLVFERKKDWWAKDMRLYKNRFNVDTFKLAVIRDNNVAFEHFKKGDIESYHANFPEVWHVKGKGEIFDKGYVQKLWFYTQTRQPAYGFSMNMDREIFRDINVRYAFAYAINFDKLNKEVLRGDYERLNNYYTGYGEYTDTSIIARKYDIKEVERYMKKSGWERGSDGIWQKDGSRYSVTVSYGTPLYNPRMIVLQEEAKKAGIEFKLEVLDGSASYKNVMEKKHEVDFSGWGGGGLRPSPWQTFHSANAHKSQTNNITNTDDPEMDKYIDAYDKSLDAKERIKLSHKIQKKIFDICAWVPLYQVPYTRLFYWRWIKHPKVPGTKNSDTLLVYPAETGLFWIDEDVKKETLKAMKEGKALEPVTIIDKTYKIND